MILTEEKAKEKFCCLNRTAWCIASECMAWDWYNETIKLGFCGLAHARQI